MTSPKSEDKRKLLVVEDDVDIRKMIQRAFGDEYEIYEAEDGQEGLEKALELEPHVIITDQRMPRMTGVEFLTEVREKLPNTIRVLITGFTDYGSLVDAVDVHGPGFPVPSRGDVHPLTDDGHVCVRVDAGPLGPALCYPGRRPPGPVADLDANRFCEQPPPSRALATQAG